MHKGVARTVLVICGLAIVGSLVVNLATGSYWFSRHPDEAIARSNESTGLDDVFAETGAGAGMGDFEQVQTTYALGWLPSGPPPSIDFLSVATIAGPAVLVGAIALWFARRGSACPRLAAATPTNDTSQESIA